MNKIFVTTVAFLLFAFTSMAQTKSINNITAKYLQIKSALASDDATKASVAAGDFSKSVSDIDMSDISPKIHTTFMQNQKTLLSESKNIATSKDIKMQRKAFANLSNSLILLAKKDKISDQTIYEDYCPMKKTSWLSDQKEIQNPYFGSSMLNCGKVTTSY